MSFKSTLAAACAVVLFALPAAAESQIEVHHPYAISSSMMATAGAAFMVVHNHGDTADRLIAARSDVSDMVQLHTHIIDENGVARMVEVAEGFEIPAGGELLLERGGNHVMFMGLHAPFVQDETVHVTLVFEQAGEIEVEIPVDLTQMGQPQAMDHGNMDHGSMDHGSMDHGAMDGSADSN
jgi:copper(I)-binding protein